MPENPVKVYCHLGHQVRHAQFESLARVAAARQRADEMIVVRYPQRAVELAQLLQMSGVDWCFRGTEPHAKATRLELANALYRAVPGSGAAIGVVDFGRSTIETHLHNQLLVGNGGQLLQPGAVQEHR